jgi:hypothetical protein
VDFNLAKEAGLCAKDILGQACHLPNGGLCSYHHIGPLTPWELAPPTKRTRFADPISDPQTLASYLAAGIANAATFRASRANAAPAAAAVAAPSAAVVPPAAASTIPGQQG